MECASKRTDLTGAQKLALLAFADSADRQTRIAFPGFDNVQMWACVGRSQANALVQQLVELGLLRKHKGGHRGRRAEYVVFPNGCCNDCQPLTHAEPTKGSSVPDSVSVQGSSAPAPFGAPPAASSCAVDSQPIGSGSVDPIEEKGSGKGPVATGPLPSFPSIPPNPQASPGGAVCAKHPTDPHPNCRGCGTTARQVEANAIRQARTAKREHAEARRRQEAAARAALRADSKAPTVQSLLEQTRKQLAAGGAA